MICKFPVKNVNSDFTPILLNFQYQKAYIYI